MVVMGYNSFPFIGYDGTVNFFPERIWYSEPTEPNPLIHGIYNVYKGSKEFLFSEISEEEITSVISMFKTF